MIRLIANTVFKNKNQFLIFLFQEIYTLILQNITFILISQMACWEIIAKALVHVLVLSPNRQSCTKSKNINVSRLVLQLSLPNLLKPGGRLNKKDGLTRYGDSHVKDKTS